MRLRGKQSVMTRESVTQGLKAAVGGKDMREGKEKSTLG